MNYLETITEMQNILNRAHKLGMYSALSISTKLFDDIDKLRYLANKEISKKIVYKIQYLNDRDFHIYKCPNCLSYLDCSNNDKYCGNCGQKLDWSDD